MLQVLLVDDEPWVLEGLRTMVNWEEHGFQVCGEALDGPEALAKMQELRPELVVTDIHMPVISGLELIERSKRLFARPPKFVILSGYDDFNYALTAMRQRVAEYLLKPIDEDEFGAILDRLGQMIAEERELEQSKLRKQTLFKNNLLNRLIQGEDGLQLEQEAAAALQLGGEPELQCMLFDAGMDPQPLKQRVLSYFSKPADADRSFMDGSGRFGMILRTDEMPQPRIEEMGLAISSELSEIGSPAVIAVSRVGKGIRSIRELYLQTLETVKAKREKGKTGFFMLCHLPQPYSSEDVLKGKVELLLAAVLQGDPGSTGAVVEEVFGALASSQIGLETLRAFAANVELTLCRRIKKAGGDADAFMVRVQGNEGESNGISDYAALKPYLLKLCREASLLLAGLRRKNENNTIFQVIQYVDEEFRSKLKLQTLAKQFHMNPTYLGQVFKKETGKTFNDYLNEKRLEEAKRLLKRTSMKISDIALQVGYPNTDYFISKFKQSIGMLPSVYKSEFQHDGPQKVKGPRLAE